MKALFRIAICFLCLVPACGGRTGADDLFDDSTVATVGGSSTENTTTFAATGGATSENATGGSSALSVTGGASNTSTATMAIPVTGGTSSVATATGGTSSTTGGMTNIATSVQQTGGAANNSATAATGGFATTIATGGTNSIGTGGSSAASTGGTITTGGSSNAPITECKPEVHVTTLWHSTATILPGTKDVPILRLSLEATCKDLEITSTGFVLTASNRDRADATAYRSSSEEFFTNITLVDVATGSDIQGPTTPKAYALGDLAHITLTDSFPLRKDTPRIVETRLDVSATYTTDRIENGYTMSWPTIGVKDGGNIPIVVSYAPDFDANNWPEFTVTATPLVVKISEDTPKSQIVLPTHDRQKEYMFSRYVIENRSDKDISFLTVELKGNVGSLYSLSVGTCNTSLYSGTWSDKGTHLIDNATMTQLFGSISWGIPAHGQMEFCIKGSPAIIDGLDGSPESGDLLNLRLVDVYTRDGIHAFIEDPNPPGGCSSAGCVMARTAAFKPSYMTLRKAQPIVSILLPPTTTLANGQNTQFVLRIASDPNGGPIKFAQYSVTYEKTAHLSLSNLRIFKDNVELINEKEVWIRDMPTTPTNGEIYVTLDKETVVGSDGSVYALVTDIGNAQNGDMLSTQLRRSGFAVSQTGSICHPDGSNTFLITDAQTCITNGPEFMGQGSFLWSDMSDSVNNKDWTDDFLVVNLDSTTTLSY